MKNFLRAVKYAWPYRRRLILSIVCAFIAAILWSLNFTALYPILTILVNKQSLQEWVDGRIASLQKDIDGWHTEVEGYARQYKELQTQPASPVFDHLKIENAKSSAKVESHLEAALRDRSRLLLLKRLVSLLPPDRFRTLVWVIALVVIGVGLKGFFDFGQESLVGSVVNLSLFDLRNRFYRKVIHLDISHFSEEGTHDLMARFTNDLQTLSEGVKTLFGKVVAEPLKALGCLVCACYISWQLTLLFLVLVPIALLIMAKVGRLMKRATRRLLERMSSIYKILQETFQSIRVVKAFTREPYERRRF
ncbi:MAG: hypothetical protein JO112_08360, partial [Planctomycetes bacterium]|nr:hypothetical protein [Planctomycetota bacterium]